MGFLFVLLWILSFLIYMEENQLGFLFIFLVDFFFLIYIGKIFWFFIILGLYI